jgi:hypothetical protein
LLKKPSTGGPSFETLALLAPQDEAFQCITSPEEGRRPVSKGRSVNFQQPVMSAC